MEEKNATINNYMLKRRGTPNNYERLKCGKVSKYQGKSGIEKNIPDVVVCETAIALVHKIDSNLTKYLAQRFKRYISTQDSIQ